MVRTGIQLVDLPKPVAVKEANAEKAQARPARAIKKAPVAAKKGMPDAAPLIIAQDRDRKSTRLNSVTATSRMPSSA